MVKHPFYREDASTAPELPGSLPALGTTAGIETVGGASDDVAETGFAAVRERRAGSSSGHIRVR
jgi:hypothetical protein